MRVTMYGSPRVHLENATIPITAQRRFQLLAYLVASADWVARDQLIAVFWAHYPGPIIESDGAQFDQRAAGGAARCFQRERLPKAR
jgi:hypothetical protein